MSKKAQEPDDKKPDTVKRQKNGTAARRQPKRDANGKFVPLTAEERAAREEARAKAKAEKRAEREAAKKREAEGRDDHGRFRPGNSGGGRPADNEKVKQAKELMMERSLEAVQKLYALMDDKETPVELQAKIAMYFTDRVFGKAAQPLIPMGESQTMIYHFMPMESSEEPEGPDA